MGATRHQYAESASLNVAIRQVGIMTLNQKWFGLFPLPGMRGKYGRTKIKIRATGPDCIHLLSKQSLLAIRPVTVILIITMSYTNIPYK